MAAELPDYYFRVRDNGAFVFRVDTENRQRRIEMDQIAVVNIRNGEIKAHGDRTLSNQDMAAISDYLHTTTHWAQSKAAPEQLEEVTDALLLAMHDLRTVLVRKKADRLLKGKG